MKIHIRDKENLVIISELDNNCLDCIKINKSETKIILCPIDNKKKRIGCIISNNGKAFGCTSDKNLIKSKKIFNRQLELISKTLTYIENYKKKLDENTRKFIHNLTKTNAHNIQELYALVPQESITKNINEQLSVIEKIILEDPKEAARTFLRIAKNNASMKIEFSIFNK